MGSRAWCFTANNPEALLDCDVQGVRYCIYQLEIGESGTEHFQGYLELHKPQRIGWVQEHILGLETAHLERRMGTPEEAIRYCSKEDSRIEGPWEYGKRPRGQGSRSDLMQVKELLDNNNPMSVIADLHFGSFIRYNRGFAEYLSLKGCRRQWQTECILLIGPTGGGKTTWLSNMCPGAYWKQPSTHWWDGYQGEEVVILDEYSGWLPYSDLLRLLDGSPLQVQRKGAQSNFLAKWVFIVSNKPINRWYKEDVFFRHSGEALLRRITRVMYFDRDHSIVQFNSYAEFEKSDEYHYL